MASACAQCAVRNSEQLSWPGLHFGDRRNCDTAQLDARAAQRDSDPFNTSQAIPAASEGLGHDKIRNLKRQAVAGSAAARLASARPQLGANQQLERNFLQLVV